MEIPQRKSPLVPITYEELPEPIRAVVTEKEWKWMSDGQKRTLVQDETEPDWEE